MGAGSSWLALGLSLALAAAAMACGGGGEAQHESAQTASTGSALAGTPFESTDGNLVIDTTEDWTNAPNLQKAQDLLSGTGDNAFGQGTKEDDPSVSVVDGSIPPNKSDLSRFYIANETLSGDFFIYLAWERTNILGSANMDFELNQVAQPDLTTPGSKTLNRTAGDVLITFDFTNGGGTPVLGLLRWLTSATNPVVTGFATNTCFSANAFPCWGDRKDLSAAQVADGAVFPQQGCSADSDCANLGPPGSFACNGPSDGPLKKTCTTIDPLYSPTINVNELTFGEAAIDLTAAGVIPAGSCVTFTSAYLKSRASSSFPAEVKDFIAPIPTGISGCAAAATTQIHSGVTVGPTHTATDIQGTAVSVGATIHDKAIVTGAAGFATPTGNVTFNRFTNGTCAGTPASTETLGLTQITAPTGSTPGVAAVESSSFTPAAGSISYQAVYNGDANYVTPVTSACEPLTVNKLTATVTTNICLDDPSGNQSTCADIKNTHIGNDTTIIDVAFVTGSGPVPTGTVTFKRFANANCSGTAANTSSPVALASDGTALSPSYTTSAAAGEFVSFIVSYSGDANYGPATAAFCEPLCSFANNPAFPPP